MLGNAVRLLDRPQRGPCGVRQAPVPAVQAGSTSAKTQEFFERYGNRAIVLGRFVPIVRTFITVMAGVGKMDARRYLTYSMIGGVAWAAGVTLLGYWLGQFAFVKANIELMLIAIVLLSVLPMIIEVLRARRQRSRIPGDG